MLQDLADGYKTIGPKLNKLIESYYTFPYKNARAREYATHGFSRRLKLIARCINSVFEKISPERAELPSRNELSDATINIQSYVFNVFGGIDNLAWIWMHERGQKRADGTPIPDTYVGLGPKNEAVRGTLSQNFQGYLKSKIMDDWFRQLTNLRHALAHRIPLYIPPYVIQTKDEGTYRELEAKMLDAVKRGDFADYDAFSVEQLKLGRFRPWVQHSFEENSRPVVFHAQMLADFNTLDELGHKMLGELASVQD